MTSENILKAIDLEIKKFEERANVLEEVALQGESSLSSKYEDMLKKKSRYSIYYLIATAVFLFFEILLLIVIRYKYGLGTLNYSILIVVTVILVFFLFMLTSSPKVEEDSIQEKIVFYRLIANKFYKRIKGGLEKGDEELIRAVADDILKDPLFSRALEHANVGDPKVVAYALYLYLHRDKVDNLEVQNTINLVRGPIRMLLESILGEDHENRGSVKGVSERIIEEA